MDVCPRKEPYDAMPRADGCLASCPLERAMEERSGAEPDGQGRGDYYEALKLARQRSLRSIRRLIELREDR
jgi:hypothetical protein